METGSETRLQCCTFSIGISCRGQGSLVVKTEVGGLVGYRVVGGRVGLRVAVGLCVEGLRVVGFAVMGLVVGGTPTQLPNVLVTVRVNTPPVATMIPFITIVYKPGPKLQHMPSLS